MTHWLPPPLCQYHCYVTEIRFDDIRALCWITSTPYKKFCCCCRIALTYNGQIPGWQACHFIAFNKFNATKFKFFVDYNRPYNKMNGKINIVVSLGTQYLWHSQRTMIYYGKFNQSNLKQNILNKNK